MNEPTKALSGYAEWFWLMATNIKPVENRSWSLTKYIKRDQLPIRIYLHASKTKTPIDEYNFITRNLTKEQYEQFRRVEWDKIRGTLFATIDVVDEITADENIGKFYSIWFFGKFGHIVRNGKLLDKPIPYKGQLGYFNVKL
jgi:hypothetical protein